MIYGSYLLPFPTQICTGAVKMIFGSIDATRYIYKECENVLYAGTFRGRQRSLQAVLKHSLSLVDILVVLEIPYIK